MKRKRDPPHRHMHCKNIISAERRQKRLLQEGWNGDIEPLGDGFILTSTDRALGVVENGTRP